MPPFASVKNEEVIKSQKGVYFLGKDIREVACLRPSLLLGITCGTVAGVISFMVTSKALFSSHVGFGSLWVVAFAYWIPCRYKFETRKMMFKEQAADFYGNAMTVVEEEKKD